jgi:acyl-coenzyme A synthetase/AMP-(fatty) acid ligase
LNNIPCDRVFALKDLQMILKMKRGLKPCGDEKVTYGKLLENVNKFANVLADLGVQPTERVMIHLPDSPMFIYAFLGSIKHGTWPVPVNRTTNTGFLQEWTD